VEPLLLQAIEARNEKQKQYLFEMLITQMGRSIVGRQIATWGLAFKPGTDDMREASSVSLIRSLRSAGAQVAAHDTVADEVARQVFADLLSSSDLVIVDNAIEAALGADALILVTEWPEYRAITPAQLNSVMIGSLVLDGRNTLDSEALKQHGFSYAGIGRR
jgi:UDPglucose 6-dehydrogenase